MSPQRRRVEGPVVSTSRWRDAGSASQDVDPVRVSPDGRIAYWTGGTPGVGTHKFERRSDPAAAKARADELRAALAAKVDPSAHRTLDELAQTMLDEMRESGTPTGTTRQYKSNWNVWVPPEVGATLCGDAGIEHVTAILRGLGSKKASRGTVNAVIRTLNTVTRTGHLYGWLAADSLGSDRLRQSAYKVARHRASGTDEAGATITLDKCPTVTEMDEFAASMAVAYPGRGRRHHVQLPELRPLLDGCGAYPVVIVIDEPAGQLESANGPDDGFVDIDAYACEPEVSSGRDD